jgi:hypothetical protein
MALSPNDMLARYLQAVGFWLPRSQKDDILAELSEDLHSQMEDREAELGHALNEAEVSAILKRRGRPMLVAGGFLPQQHLIGPVLFPTYILVLKIIALCYLVPWILVWLGILIFDRAQASARLASDLHSLGSFWTIAFTLFGVATLVFAVLDRASTHGRLAADWDPRKLPKVKPQPAAKNCAGTLTAIAFGFFGLFWLLAIDKYPFLILGPGVYLLKAAPIWQTVYGPIIALSVAGIVENVVVLARPHLTWFRPVFRVATNAFSLWIVSLLYGTRTYFLPVHQQAAPVTAVANITILICVIGMGIALIIGLFIYAWQAIQEVRRSLHPATASLA